MAAPGGPAFVDGTGAGIVQRAGNVRTRAKWRCCLFVATCTQPRLCLGAVAVQTGGGTPLFAAFWPLPEERKFPGVFCFRLFLSTVIW